MILLTGATGIVGKNLLKIFAKEKIQVVCIVRNNNNYKTCQAIYPDAHFVFGEVSNANLSLIIDQKISMIVHCAVALTNNIYIDNMNMMKNLISYAKEKNITHFFNVSSVEATETSNDPYPKAKRDSEKLLIESGIPYTILRSWQIYGEIDHFRAISRFINQIKKSIFIPIIGNGHNLMQPVYVGDVVNVILKLMNQPVENKVYNIYGKTTYTYSQVISILSTFLNKKIYKIHIPLFLLMPAIFIYEKIFPNSFLNRKKIKMFLRDEYGNIDDLYKELQYYPVDLYTGLQMWKNDYNSWNYSKKNGIFDR